MRPLVRQRPSACLAVALIAALCTAQRDLPAQSASNPRFDALVSLADAADLAGSTDATPAGLRTDLAVAREIDDEATNRAYLGDRPLPGALHGTASIGEALDGDQEQTVALAATLLLSPPAHLVR